MEKLKNRRKSLEKAFIALDKAIKFSKENNSSDDFKAICRDAIIKRFEFTLELFWKVLKDYLSDQHGLAIASPKGVINQCSDMGLISKAEHRQCVGMIEDRNLTSHTYDEEFIIQLLEHIQAHYRVMAAIFQRLT
jgi:nucleotidyltransferase substrate binding protein (TIGR01987 family)